MEEKTIYDLKLHEYLNLTDTIRVLRVPSGWLYVFHSNVVFVPYDNMFKGSDKS